MNKRCSVQCRAKLRAIHREIQTEFDKIDHSKEWSFSLKGINVKYIPKSKLSTSMSTRAT